MSDQGSSPRHGCDFACSEPLCRTLDRAGVPPDGKWRTLILYMRGIESYDFLSENQKANIQALVIKTLQERDFSDENFEKIMLQQEEIINGPCNRRLQSALSETAEMVEEFRKVLRRRGVDVESLGNSTVRSIQQGDDTEQLIEHLKRSFQEVVEIMRRDADNLDQLSRTDGLTGIMNRRALDEYLDLAIQQWRLNKKPLSLLMLDIDHFKNFNDNYGHRIGDQALITLAKLMLRLKEDLAKEAVECFCARYGGEEFTIVLPGVGVEQAQAIAEDLRKTVERYNFIIRDSNGEVLKRNIHITISIGVAQMHPSWRGALVENLVDAADKALYEAKSGGRNLVCAAAPPQGAERACS